MSKHSEEVNELIGNGFSRNDANELADSRALKNVLSDEDEEYINNEIVVDEESGDELDTYTDDTMSDFEYSDDEEDELDFNDGYKFADLEDEE